MKVISSLTNGPIFSENLTYLSQVFGGNYTNCLPLKKVIREEITQTVCHKTKQSNFNQVSCKCCRSVMGRIVHEVRQSEKAVNIANLKPYRPRTSVITNVKVTCFIWNLLFTSPINKFYLTGLLT